MLRRITPAGQLAWQWTSAGKINPADEVRPGVAQMVGRVMDVDNKLNWVFKKILDRAERLFNLLLAKLGLLDRPLCLQTFDGCLVETTNDYVHANSLDWDADGGIILFSRVQKTAFKIEYPSGKILWTLGGYGARHSDFKILNDLLGGFSYRHSVRSLPNGNILMYENGDMRPAMLSRAVEYQLDMS